MRWIVLYPAVQQIWPSRCLRCLRRASCSPPRRPRDPKAGRLRMSQTNVQAAQRLYDAFNSGNLEAFEQGVASHLIWNQAENGLNSSGNPYRTFAQVRDGVFAPTMRDFDNFQVALERLIDAGDFVIGNRALSRQEHGDWQGPFGPVLPHSSYRRRRKARLAAAIYRHAAGSGGDGPRAAARSDGNAPAGTLIRARVGAARRN